MTSILKYLNRALLVLLLAAFAACSDNEGGNESNGNGDDGNTETPADGDTYGYIKDTNGNPVEGVVVSDGYSCTATDAEGRYALTRNADAGFVFYSLPSAYKVSVDKTYKLPRFFARLQAGTARYDFTLEALAAPEKRFDLICIGDPQINEASHAVRFKEEAGREIREYAASAGVPCYGITLGDHVNNKWTLFTNMVVALQPEQTGVPVFATIGNHDLEPNILSELNRDDDMRLAVYKGEANQLNFQMACPLGRSLLTGLGANLLAHLPDGEQKTRIIEEYGKYFDFASEPPSVAHLRFGHAESILPLYYLFVLEGEGREV